MLIDYNQAGNDIYISDMLQWGTYLVYGLFMTDNESQLNVWFDEYCRGYEEKYQMDNSEKECFPLLYKLIRPLRCDQIWKLQDKHEASEDDYVKNYISMIDREYGFYVK